MRRPVYIPEPLRRVMGVGGLGLDAGRAYAFGGQMSFGLSPRMSVMVEGGQFSDLTTDAMRRDAEEASYVLSALGQSPVSISVRVPALYALSGLRYSVVSSGLLQPYVEGNAGLARLTPSFSAWRLGVDVSQTIAGTAFQNNSLNLMFGATGGVVVPVGDAAAIDFGYRFLRGYDKGETTFEVGRMILGIGTRF